MLTIRSEMLSFSENNQNINNVRSPPEHFAIGYVHNDNLPLGNTVEPRYKEVEYNKTLL